MTLIQATQGPKTMVKQGLVVMLGSLFIAICAQVSIPFYPVPMTLQTLAILLVGLSLGPRLGVVTLLVYLAQGAAGLPVFANGMNGAAFFGPTAGFLVGFVGLVALAGLAAERLRGVVPLALACVLATTLLYVPGILWPMTLAPLVGLESAWAGQSISGTYWPHFIAPFVIGDIVKAVLAVLLVKGLTNALKR